LIIFFAADLSIKKVLGGGERVLCEQTARLSERRHEIRVITRRLPIHQSSYEYIKNVHEWRYSVNKKNTFTFLVSTVLNCQKSYKQISHKISIDLINFHQPFSAFAKSSGTTMFIVVKKVILLRKFLSKYKKKAKVVLFRSYSTNSYKHLGYLSSWFSGAENQMSWERVTERLLNAIRRLTTTQ